MVSLDRIRKVHNAIWTVPAQPAIEPPAPPDNEDRKSEKEYERALEEYNQKKEARRKRHEDTSTTIRRIYYAILSTALFCFSVVHGRKDVSFISTSSNVKLPLVNVDVSYSVFLLVGPCVILGLTAYVHIFLEEHRKIEVEQEDRLATIFNMDSLSARYVSHAIFYWLPPLTLFYFAWEAQPLRVDGPILLGVTVVTALVLFFLQIRRTRRHSGMTAFAVIGYFVVVAGCSYFYMQAGRNFSLEGETIIDQDLTIMKLAGASLEGTTMTKVDLFDVDLRGANLSGATITDSDFSRSDLTGANLAGATLSNVNLRGAILIDADLNNARLVNGTQVERARLRGAKLDGADLTGAMDLTTSQLSRTCGDGRTRLPASVTVQNPEIELELCSRRENTIIVGGPALTGSIDEAGGTREYTFGVTDWGLYQIDVAGRAREGEQHFDPTALVRGRKLETDLYDDDSGNLRNARIINHLEPGLYSLTVGGFQDEVGGFTVRIGNWDGRSVSGFDGIEVPADRTEIPTITVNDLTTAESVRRTPDADTAMVWINVRNPERRNIVVTAQIATGATEEGRFGPDAPTDPDSTDEPEFSTELLLMLFDASAAYTPIAIADDFTRPGILCTIGLRNYLVLAGSYFDRPEIEVTVSLAEEQKAPPGCAST